MKGLWLRGGDLSFRDDIAEPTPGKAGECVVRVIQAGICSTDHAMLAGLFPYDGVLGHEFVGVVENGPEALAGKRVVGEINASCGKCSICLAGRTKHCPHRTVLGIVDHGGAFADYLRLPEENLHVVPESVPDDAAVFVEPLAAALDVLEQITIGRHDRVLLVGAGKLGQLIARVLATVGCLTDVVVRSPEKRARLEALPARLIGADEVETQAYDVAIECTGNEEGFAVALAGVRPQGALVLKSTFPGLVAVDVTKVVVDEIRLIGSRCGPFDKAVALLEAGKIETGSLIDARFPLADGLAAVARSREPGTLKVLLDIIDT